jgi:hypothetical protein
MVVEEKTDSEIIAALDQTLQTKWHTTKILQTEIQQIQAMH